MEKLEKQTVLTLGVDVTSYGDASALILSRAEMQASGYVCVANVHMCMEAYDDPAFSRVVNDAFLVVPDGKPLVWAQILLGSEKAEQVRGADLLLAVCREAEEKGVPIGLYGGTEDSLSDFICFLEKTFPQLSIVYRYSPPFRELTDAEHKTCIEKIRSSGAKILFVGIGCPKQETWMAGKKDRLACVMIGVGAAFDFFSGRKKHAPRWMQRSGLEWLFRLFSDPKRLWKRYALHNPRFIALFGLQVMRKKMKG